MARGTYQRTKLANRSTHAFISSLNAFNNASDEYRVEAALFLMVNAVELLSKALVLKHGGKIYEKGTKERTISAEASIWLLFNQYHKIDELEHGALQQLISLRNEASHNILPSVKNDVLHYLMFSAFKVYRRLINDNFRSHNRIFKKSFLSISTDENTTYADSVEGLLRSSKKSESQRRLLYLLERGVSYKGDTYITQDAFEKNFRKQKNKRLINRSKLGKFLSEADLLKVVFIQAPKNHTINIDIAKGIGSQKEALTVFTRRTDINKDYPYILTTLAEKLGKGRNVTLQAIKQLSVKGDKELHQEVKTGKQSSTHKYSDAAFQKLKNHFDNL